MLIFQGVTHSLETASLETSSSRYLNLTTIVYSLGLVVSVLLLRWGRAEEAAGWVHRLEVDGFFVCQFFLSKKKTKLVGYLSWLGGGTEKKEWV